MGKNWEEYIITGLAFSCYSWLGVGGYSIYSWKTVYFWPCHSLNCLPQNSLNPPLSRPEICQVSRTFQKRIPVIQPLIPTLQPLLPSSWSCSKWSPPDASRNLGGQAHKFILAVRTGPGGRPGQWIMPSWPVDIYLMMLHTTGQSESCWHIY